MLIDSHSHLKHGDAQKTEYSPDEIVRVMDAAGIDKSVVFAMSTSTSRSIQMAKDAIDKFQLNLYELLLNKCRPSNPVKEKLLYYFYFLCWLCHKLV